MLSAYPACFIKENTGYSVIFPDLDIATCGDGLEDALAMAIDCLAGYLYTANLEGKNVPPASSFKTIDPQKIMNELEVTSDEAFVNIVTVDVAEYAKTHFTTSVRKNLTIPSWLNDAAMKQHINFSQVLQEALLQKLQAK
mgnify:CR=1 FL=1